MIVVQFHKHTLDYRVQSKTLVHTVYPEEYMASTHHWMISVIWASHCATLSFLSVSSLISSSTCLWLLLNASYMDFTWKKRGRVGNERMIGIMKRGKTLQKSIRERERECGQGGKMENKKQSNVRRSEEISRDTHK